MLVFFPTEILITLPYSVLLSLSSSDILFFECEEKLWQSFSLWIPEARAIHSGNYTCAPQVPVPSLISSFTSWQYETEDHFHVPWQFSVFSLALEGWLLASFVNAFIQESDNFSHCKLHFLELDLTKLNIDTVKKRFGAIFSFSVKIQTFPKKRPDWFKNDIMIFFFSSLLLQTLSSSMSL